MYQLSDQNLPDYAIYFYFFSLNVKIYNTCYILLYSNYYATLRGRYHEEQETMSTPWPTHKDIQLNRQLNKYVQKGTHTIRYYKWWKLFHIGCQVSGGEISAVSDTLQSPTAQEIASKLSGFIGHKKKT